MRTAAGQTVLGLGLCLSIPVYAGGLLKTIYSPSNGPLLCDHSPSSSCPSVTSEDFVVTPQWVIGASEEIEWKIHVGPNITISDLSQCQAQPFCHAVHSAFQTWQQNGNVNLRFRFGGSTPNKNPNNPIELDPWGKVIPDGVNLISFNSDIFDLLELPNEVLAITFIYDHDFEKPSNIGRIRDADIYFNPRYNPYAKSIPPSQPQFTTTSSSSQLDVQSIALHEIGHAIGLSHSLVRNAVMYPSIGSTNVTQSRALKSDDIAWAGFLYPTSKFNAEYGQIRGRVLHGVNGDSFPVIHVMAFPDGTQDAFIADNSPGSLAAAAGYSERQGEFIIPGLAPGRYYLIAEALDGSPEAAIPARISALLQFLAPKTVMATEFYDGPGRESNVEPVLSYSPQSVKAAALVVATGGQAVSDIELISNFPAGDVQKVLVAKDPTPREAVILSDIDLETISKQSEERLNEPTEESGGGCYAGDLRTSSPAYLFMLILLILAGARFSRLPKRDQSR